MKIYKNKIDHNTINVVFQSTFGLCSTLCRFQEHYESPYFSGKYFTLTQFRNWYKKSKKCNVYTYNHDWGGFNIPSSILKPFYDGKFSPLSKKEKQFLDLFSDEKGLFYIIATSNDGIVDDVIIHELCHSKWFTLENYRNTAINILKTIDKNKIEKFRNVLQKMGYGLSVLDDEINAYITCSKSDQVKIFKFSDLMVDDFTEQRHKLINLFNDNSSTIKISQI